MEEILSQYPVINGRPKERFCEYLVAKDFLRRINETDYKIFLGNDQKGISDIFVFKQNTLVYCIEISAYIFNYIQDLNHSTIKNGVLHINVSTSITIHRQQPDPFTIWIKKIENSQRYRKFDSMGMVLLLHSDVNVHKGKLSFAFRKPFGMSPSINNFFHHRESILYKLKMHIKQQKDLIWDKVYLIDYSDNFEPRACPMHMLL